MTTTGMEKRTFKRHNICLAGNCNVSGAINLATEIWDFCPLGMLLSFPSEPQLGQGERLEVRCTVPTAEGSQELQFRGLIVHASPNSAGIAFIEPDFDALRILYDYAKSHPVSPDGRETGDTSSTESQNDNPVAASVDLIPACKALVFNSIELPPTAWR